MKGAMQARWALTLVGALGGAVAWALTEAASRGAIGELAALASSRAVRELSSRPRPYGAAGERSTKTTACCPQRTARPPWRAVYVSASASEENHRLG